ncbi:unnamed protein product [Protopolystoma xenopodis]|uniref:Uncharacterized protein n=1 Tax=Protopolystoma xenopodis TaxID=117903 RepID=A0A3S4ZFZ5_9PLAT|nr:unnamed protein product [Protopolystoma xenopodis]
MLKTSNRDRNGTPSYKKSSLWASDLQATFITAAVLMVCIYIAIITILCNEPTIGGTTVVIVLSGAACKSKRQVRSLVGRMAKLTDDADYDAVETFEKVSSPMSDAGADDFGLGAFYIVALATRPSCDNEEDDFGLGAFY